MISCNNFSRSRHRRCARINCSKRTAADISAALCDLPRLIFRVYVWTVNGLTERGKTPRKTNDRRARNESSAGSWHYRRRLIHRRPIVITVDGRQIGWRGEKKLLRGIFVFRTNDRREPAWNRDDESLIAEKRKREREKRKRSRGSHMVYPTIIRNFIAALLFAAEITRGIIWTQFESASM